MSKKKQAIDNISAGLAFQILPFAKENAKVIGKMRKGMSAEKMARFALAESSAEAAVDAFELGEILRDINEQITERTTFLVRAEMMQWLKGRK